MKKISLYIFVLVILPQIGAANEKNVCSNVGSSFFLDAYGVKIELPYTYFVTVPEADFGATISLHSPELSYVKNNCDSRKLGFIHAGLIKDFNKSYFKTKFWSGFSKKAYKNLTYWFEEPVKNDEFTISQIYVEYGKNFILLSDVDHALQNKVLEQIVNFQNTKEKKPSSEPIKERLKDLRKMSREAEMGQ